MAANFINHSLRITSSKRYKTFVYNQLIPINLKINNFLDVHLVISRLIPWTNNGLAAVMIVIIELERPNFGEKAQTESSPRSLLCNLQLSLSMVKIAARPKIQLSFRPNNTPAKSSPAVSIIVIIWSARRSTCLTGKCSDPHLTACRKWWGVHSRKLQRLSFYLFMWASTGIEFLPEQLYILDSWYFFLSRCGISDFRMQYFLSRSGGSSN